MKAKYTKEELKYLMKFHEIEEMPVYYKGQNVGEVNQSLKYRHGRSGYLTRDEDAIYLAIQQIDDFVKFKKSLNEPFTAKVLYIERKWNPYREEEKGEYIYEGTMDEVFEKFYNSNRHLRYCNDLYYKFTDKNVEHLYQLWNDSMSYSRSFDLYYGGGIVD